MGKWATYKRRGGSNFFGTVAAPGVVTTDWSLGAVTATTIGITRNAGIPANATVLFGRAINNTTNLVVAESSGGLSGLVTATTYRVATAWFNGAIRVSDWSPATLVTTA